MAKKACSGVIEIGAGPAVVGELRNWTQNSEAAEIDTSVMGTCVSRIQPGSTRESLELGTFFENTDAGQAVIQSSFASDTPVAIAIYPFGKTTGLAQATGNFFILTRNISGDVDGSVEMDITANSDSNGITWGTVP